MTATQLTIKPDGRIVGIYSDAIDYRTLGKLTVRRASHVEPTENAQWIADLSPVGGPRLGPFDQRDEAIAQEIEYLERMIGEPGFAC
jgi:hypothetical protein